MNRLVFLTLNLFFYLYSILNQVQEKIDYKLLSISCKRVMNIQNIVQNIELLLGVLHAVNTSFNTGYFFLKERDMFIDFYSYRL